LEIIVVDDGSNDDTLQLVSEYKNPRVIYIKHEQNMGLAAARNTGIKSSSGDIVAFQDTDDLWLENKVEECIKAFRLNPKISIVYSGSYRFQGRQKAYIPYSYISKKNGNVLESLLSGNFIPAISVCIKRGCFDEIGLFDESLPSLEDWDILIRLAKKYQFFYIPKPLNLIYFSEDSLTANSTNFLKAEEILLKKHYDEFCRYPVLLAKRYGQLGFYYAFNKSPIKCFEFLRKAANISKKYYVIYGLAKILGLDFIRAASLLYQRGKWFIYR
jgi:glycosyltransferase involved in cell wall biosynthesis